MFFKCGTYCDLAHDVECRHDIECGDANCINSDDFLQFDQCITCKKPCADCEIDDPEKDVIKMINKEIYKSIAGVLNDIVSGSITQAFENIIEFDDSPDWDE